MRILLVEDDDMIGESVMAGLETEGHAIDWVRDGNSALLALNTTPYSLVNPRFRPAWQRRVASFKRNAAADATQHRFLSPPRVIRSMTVLRASTAVLMIT